MAAYLLLFLVICFSVVCLRVDSAVICFVTKESAMHIEFLINFSWSNHRSSSYTHGNNPS